MSGTRRLSGGLPALTTGVSRLKAIDERLLRLLRTRFSRLGEHSRLWLSLALAGAATDRRHRGLYMRLVGTLIATEVVNALVKLAIARPRPCLPGLSPLTSTRSARSCPSAHASTSFAAARLLSRALPAAPVYSAAGAMALSRPCLGVHYPSDVLLGVGLGTALAEIGSS